MRTSAFPLYDRLLDGRLADILRDLIADQGLSYEEATYRLRSEHEVEVSKSTVRRWCIERGIEPEAASA